MEDTVRKEYNEWYAKEVGVLGTLHHKAWLMPWLASRKSVVVTLPKIDAFETEANLHIDTCAKRIEAAGLTVAYDKENDNG